MAYTVHAFIRGATTTKFVYKFANRREALEKVTRLKRLNGHERAPGLDLIECWSGNCESFGSHYSVSWFNLKPGGKWIRRNNNVEPDYNKILLTHSYTVYYGHREAPSGYTREVKIERGVGLLHGDQERYIILEKGRCA